jgi:hypothetical protein
MSRLPAVTLALALLALPNGAAAQATPWRTTDQLAAAARLRAAAEAPAARPGPDLALASPRSQRRQGTVLMIVGGAGIVTGLIVDEPIVTIAGAAVGGFGLYMYLNSGGEVRVGAYRPGGLPDPTAAPRS